MWKVIIMEYEPGWGSRVDEIVKFSTENEALAFVKDYNKDNGDFNASTWVMYALRPQREA